MSDNWTPPPGRNPDEPEREGDQPTDQPANGPARGDGQSPLWWTESTEKQKEYLQPAPPGEQPPLVGPPGQRPGNLTWNLPPYSQPGATPAGPPQAGRPPAGHAPAGPPPAGPPPAGTAPAGPGPSAGGRRGARHAGPPQSGRGTQQPGAAAGDSGAGWQQPAPTPAEGGFQGLGQPVQQPQTWQYPPIPIPQPPGPGRRRKPRRTSRALLIGLVVLAVLVVGSGVTLILRNTGDDKVPASAETPTTAPSVTPSETPSATPTTPAPPTVDEIVTTSRLYTVGVLSPTQCLEPKAVPSTFAGAKAYYGLIVPCMNRTWWLAMKKASLPYRAPKLVVFAGPMKTVCGAESGNRAFYCGTNETIYMPYALGAAYYKRNPVTGRVWMMNTLAHEYGHHVQKLSGIYAASLSRQVNAASPADQLTESRRRELQASCFGSAYLGAAGPYIPLRGPLLATWKVLIANTGDEYSRPRVHDRGNRVNHNYWSVRGFNTKSPNVCNTFVAQTVLTN
ncbi:neutral zinc metallopeptidase [Kribbella catacumbae]|uniref:neutral zinc metallopeptidase n=1 Tax=Kribbella catacumbae TaxID=460086 RepID=UPI000A2F6B18|nr:neutral zinc metallopeptidase [Kribbella catacumbae]